MTRRVVTINTEEDRAKISRWARQTNIGTVVEFRKKSRSTEQNAKLWAMLGEVADQVIWYGQKLDADDWKDLFTAALRNARVVPGIDKGSYVPLGMRTSNMTIDEMGDLIELIYAFGALPEHPVSFKDSVTSTCVPSQAPVDDEPSSSQVQSSRPEETPPLSGSSGQQIETEEPHSEVSQDAAADTSPQSPAASNPIPEKELVILCKFAKDALTTAKSLPEDEGMKRVVNRWLNGELVNVTSDSGKAAIKSIRLSVAAIMRNDGEVNFNDVVQIHAEGLGCEPDEIGG